MNPPAYRRQLPPFWRLVDWLCERVERVTGRRLYTTERASEYEEERPLRCTCEGCPHPWRDPNCVFHWEDDD